jgi:NAD(P)-dependent dehydrogenase (short-subunit alcohol dehydrogenase family)
MSKLVVITGAAGGMGSAVAAKFAEQGADLLLCDLRREPIERVAEPLRARAKSIEILAEDLASLDFPGHLVAALRDREIFALVHTAGLSPTMADAARILEVNYDATERLVDAVRPRMAEGGCAVLIASSAGHMVVSPEIDAALKALVPGEGSASLVKMATTPQMAYPISKRAVLKLVAREAAAFGTRNARIASISPGLIDTGMSRAEQAASSQMDMLLARTPLARYGTADEIATAALFLCSPAASYITGSDIRVDGGTLGALGF